jgi:AmiR/NasT family two-component response regulator
VIVSAITDASFITQAMQKGAKGYITKPLKIKDPEFISRVKEDLMEVMAA